MASTPITMTYKDQEYEFDFDTLTVEECCELQSVTGYTPAMILSDFARGGVFGVFGLLYTAMRRAKVPITWKQLQQEKVFSVIKGDSDIAGDEVVDPSAAAPSPALPPQRPRTSRKK